jgi:hypothetical protein
MLAYFTATNDPDANPRRGFAYLSDGRPVAFWPESYHGHHAVPGSLRAEAYAAMSWPIGVTAAAYGKLCRLESPDYWQGDRPSMVALVATAKRVWFG